MVCNIYISINNQLAKNKCDKINFIESSYPMKTRHLATFEIHQLKKGASHSWSSPDNLLIRLVLGTWVAFLRLISSVLYHDEEVVSVGSHHDFVLLCPQPHESEVIARVNFLEHCLGLVN